MGYGGTGVVRYGRDCFDCLKIDRLTMFVFAHPILTVAAPLSPLYLFLYISTDITSLPISTCHINLFLPPLIPIHLHTTSSSNTEDVKSEHIIRLCEYLRHEQAKRTQRSLFCTNGHISKFYRTKDPLFTEKQGKMLQFHVITSSVSDGHAKIGKWREIAAIRSVFLRKMHFRKTNSSKSPYQILS